MEQSENDTTNQQERLLDLAWLAGFVEGEGCFTVAINGQRITPRIYIINTDLALIDRVSTIFKRENIGFYRQTRKGGCGGSSRWKTAYTVEIAGMKRVRHAILELLPYLFGNKKRVAETLLAYIERRLSLPNKPKATREDWEYVERIRTLNRKGPKESSETTRSTLCSEDIVQA